jgi:hypothetical protein
MEMPDFYEQFSEEWESSLRASTQPSSPLSLGYVMRYQWQPYGPENKPGGRPQIAYSFDVRWSKHVQVLAKLVSPHQIWHRSRTIALGASPLRKAEADKRIKQIHELMPWLRKSALTDKESYEIFRIITDNTKKHLHINWNWIAHYIKDHMASSLGGGGYKWRDALTIDRSGWKEIFELVRSNIETMEQHPDWYVANRPRTGLRARSESFDLDDTVGITAGETHWPSKEYYEVWRTRIITFGNYMSLYTVFIPDKASWYQKTLEEVMNYLKVEGEYHFPYMEGGKIYRTFSDLHINSKEFHACDGKSWDCSAGIILGKYMRCYMVPYGGFVQVATGQSHTSMNDTIGLIVASRHIKGKKVCLGDDLNLYDGKPPKVPYIEEDPFDTKYRYCLGMSFYDDPEVPRISGFKVSTDRATKMIPLGLVPYQWEEVAVGGKHSYEEIATHAGMFAGRFGSGTLLERIEKLPPSEYKSPGELLEELAANNRDAVAQWAEDLGIGRVIIR